MIAEVWGRCPDVRMWSLDSPRPYSEHGASVAAGAWQRRAGDDRLGNLDLHEQALVLLFLRRLFVCQVDLLGMLMWFCGNFHADLRAARAARSSARTALASAACFGNGRTPGSVIR
jgi:hypothetical protein